MNREKVLAQCEWAIKQPSPTIIEAKKFYEEVLALLKELEPIWNDVLNVWTCPSCGQLVSTNYCRDCGRKLKWE